MAQLDFLKLTNPKRRAAANEGWQGFFPYYAGFPETFVKEAIESLDLPTGSLVLDPWNGSGTTTSACSALGLPAWGIDINPAMVIVAKARLLPPSEADSLRPLCVEILSKATGRGKANAEEPLGVWFDSDTATHIRQLELNIRKHLVGTLTIGPNETRLGHLSTLASAFYVALFSSVRMYLQQFRTANPTWLRDGRRSTLRISVPKAEFRKSFELSVGSMADELAERPRAEVRVFSPAVIELADTSCTELKPQSVDLVVTSPPYCTRLDYVASTRSELAVVQPWLNISVDDLSRHMTGTVKVPKVAPRERSEWGSACVKFLEAVRSHSSKASATYYYKNHADYFDKLYRSLANISHALKPGASAIIVVQDSFYKDVHNPLPEIVSEMAKSVELSEVRRESFVAARSMSSVNTRSTKYRTHRAPVESVLCFQRSH